jgi:ribose transport system permease protein
MSQSVEEQRPAVGKTEDPRPQRHTFSRLVGASRVEKIGAVYVLIAIIVLFSLWKPSIFPTWTTAKSILDQNAIGALAALALVVPLSTGVFDLSIGNVMALVSVTLAWLIVQHGVPIGLAIPIVIVMSAVVGALNAVIVVILGIDSFIATLGTGAVLQAVNLLISNDETVTDAHLNSAFGKISQTTLVSLQVPVFVVLVIALCIWWLLERTVTGRRLYATGFNEEASRLAGVRTKRLRFISLIVSSVVAGIAGLLLTSQIGSGSPDIGPSYLLDAFAAAFLGATQIRAGRFNAAGTVIAILVLGTGTTGLTLVGAQAWALSLYTGVVLIAALALTRIERKQVRAGRAP